MDKLDKKLIIADWNSPLSLREYFKEVLKIVLITNPPKRLMGNSGWTYDLFNACAKEGVVSGGTEPCCKEKCKGEDDFCSYGAKKDTKELEKELSILIDAL